MSKHEIVEFAKGGSLGLGLVGVALVIIWLLAGCADYAPSRSFKNMTWARVTFYNKHEDRFRDRTAMGGRAREGVTVAAPRALPFGLRVIIPALRGTVGDGQFCIQDRGSALEKAYRHGQLRLDVYVATRMKLRQCKYCLPEYMEAKIE